MAKTAPAKATKAKDSKIRVSIDNPGFFNKVVYVKC